MINQPGFRAAPAVKANVKAQPQAAPAQAAPPAKPAPKPAVKPAPKVVAAQAQVQKAPPPVQQKRAEATQAANQRAQVKAQQAEEKQAADARQAKADAKAQQQKAAPAAAQAAQANPAKANDAKPAQAANQAAGQNAGQAAPAKADDAKKGAIDAGAAKANEVGGKAIDQAAKKIEEKLPEPLKGAVEDLAKQAKAGLGDALKGAAPDAKNMAKDGGAKLEAAADKAIDKAVADMQKGLVDKLPAPLQGPAKEALAKAAEALKGEVGKQIQDGLAKLAGGDQKGVPGLPPPGAPAAPPAVPGAGVQPPGAAPAPGGAPAPAGAGGGQLVKLSIKPEKGEEIKVQYNPAEYTVVKSTPWKHHHITGLDAPAIEFTSGEPTRLHFELIADTYEAGTNVREITDKIEKLALVHQELHRPPAMLLTWGTGLLYKCVLERYHVRYTLFSEAGVALRAVMNCIFKEFSPQEEQLKGAPRHSPDRTKRRVLKEGETLSGIAGREYEDPTQWRLIADANGIMDPMAVRPGMELRIPPLIRHR